MGMLDTIEKKIGKKIEEKVEEKIKDAPKDTVEKVGENVYGRVCVALFKGNEKNQNRCKALARLPEIAKSGAATVSSCGAVLVAEPAGALAIASCGYNMADFGDKSFAMGKQLGTGDDVKTLKEQGIEMVGAVIMKKAKAEYERQVQEAASSHYRQVSEMNGGMTPAQYDRLQAAEDSFNTGNF